MKSTTTALTAGLVVALAGCAHTPSGPTVTVMPAPYKPFELFMADDTVCRDIARGRIGEAADPAESEAAAGADRSSRGLQRRYDVTYQQCMYAKGNQIPGWAPVAVPAPPPPPSAPPPPPPRK